MEIVQAQLKPLGIEVTPRLVEWNTLVARLQENVGARGWWLEKTGNRK